MSLDFNSIYRIDTVGSNHTRSLRRCTGDIVCFSSAAASDTSAQWQLIPVDSSSLSTSSSAPRPSTTIGPLSIRNIGFNSPEAIAVHGTGNGTDVVFRPVDMGDVVQQWRLVLVGNHTTGEPIWQFKSAANGTGFTLSTNGEDVSLGQQLSSQSLNQGWILTSVSPNNPASPTATPSASTSVKHGLSGGAIAGIAIGAAGGIALVAGIVWLVLRKRKTRLHEVYDYGAEEAKKAASEVDGGTPPPPFSSVEEKKKPLPVKASGPTEGKAELSDERDQGYIQRHELA